MKIALAQINPKVGDIRGNLEKINSFKNRAEASGADLAVFPEQSLAGYPALDLWEEHGFAAANEKALKELTGGVGEMGVLVGYVAHNPRKTGKPIFNAAALLHRGKIAAIRYKSLLPTYDVFDEARYFEPAPAENAPIIFKGVKIGVTICEDAWARQPVGAGLRRLYKIDPVALQARRGAQILINTSASPFTRNKSMARLKLLSQHARRWRKPFLYCNLVGGNDEIIFDGNSLAFDAKGRVITRGKSFGEDLVVVDTEQRSTPLSQPLFKEDIVEVAEALTLGIHDYAGKCGFSKIYVGLSGGIDSAVVCALAARALGPDNVTCVMMPSPYSSQASMTDAKALIANLTVRFLILPITAIFSSYKETLKGVFAGLREDVTEQNIQARIRGNLLMALANKMGGMVLSTGNKSELSVGYCTLYGDMSGGLAVLADVPKKTVYELARWFNREREIIPQNIIAKAPSAELKPNQKDQDDLPPYDVLDGILTAYIEEGLGPEEIATRGYSRALVDDIISRIDRAEYKRRQAPPSLKISCKAFGLGRRMPIVRNTYHLS